MTLATRPTYGAPLPGPIAWPRAGSRGAYGYQRTPTHRHQGIDLRAPMGTPWLAVADGVVRAVRTGPDTPPMTGYRGYGRVVVLEVQGPGGAPRYVLYAHGSRVDVHVGERVTRGQVLGAAGNSTYTRAEPRREQGRSHLHLEVATRPYPMGSEAPYRVDPTSLLRPAAGATPLTDPTTRTAGEAFRRSLMRRMADTDAMLIRAQTQLRRAGQATAATLLLSTWSRARAPLIRALREGGTVDELRRMVGDWLAELAELARQARRLVPDYAAQVTALEERIRRLWTEGIEWARGVVRDAATAGGMGLLVLAALWALSQK